MKHTTKNKHCLLLTILVSFYFIFHKKQRRKTIAVLTWKYPQKFEPRGKCFHGRKGMGARLTRGLRGQNETQGYQ